jgi:hypothetical protein
MYAWLSLASEAEILRPATECGTHKARFAQNDKLRQRGRGEG